jgi:hypothetical protein
MSWDRDIVPGVAHRGCGVIWDVQEFFAELLSAQKYVADVTNS